MCTYDKNIVVFDAIILRVHWSIHSGTVTVILSDARDAHALILQYFQLYNV